LDHFYLRSFATGTQKLVVNMLTFGFWYWWDLIQILADGQTIRTKGLQSPLDWIRGIGRGTFTPPQATNAPKDPNDFGYGSKKSYLLYAFLAIFFGCLGADKFYMGELWQGLAKLLSCFNIFLFLFGWLWVLWDSFYAFFLTESILQNGISAPLPYSMVFSEPIPGSLFQVKKLTAEDMKPVSFSFGELCSRWFGIPIPSLPVREIYKELVAPLLTVPVVRALQAVGPNRPPPQPSCFEDAQRMLPTPAQVHETVMEAANTGRVAVQAVAEPVVVMSKGVGNAIHAQSGGGSAPSAPSGPGPVIAGALTAVVLAGGLKGFYDMISKQYG
jgi:TM2 domain-containing membrane protein YozV